jgi:hypothetical protein
MRAVADYVAFSTQHGILQRNRIENPCPFRGTLDH